MCFNFWFYFFSSSSAVGLKNCAITSGIKKFEPIIKKKWKIILKPDSDFAQLLMSKY